MGCGSSAGSNGPSDPSVIAEDHFVRGRQVGEGGFGKVFAMRHYQSKQWFAMKELSKKTVRKSKNITMIFNERNLLAQLPMNAFIVNMHHAFQDYESCFILLDLAMGGDLRYHCKRSGNKMADNKCRFYTLCVLLALEFLHANDIVHRDVKPENVVLVGNGYCLLTDFGISKKLNTEGFVEGTSGTRAYMAPECFQPGSKHGIKADCWSLGVLAYELAAGNNVVLSGQTGSFQTSRLSGDGVRNFCERCLKEDPEQRSSMEELSQDPWFSTLDLSKFKEQTLEAPWIPDSNKTYFEMASGDMESALDTFGAPQKKKFVPGSDSDFANYEFNNIVGAGEAETRPAKPP